MLRKTVTISVLFGLVLLTMVGCGSPAETVQEGVGIAKTEVETETITEVTGPDVLPDRVFGDSNIPTFELTSEDLHDGV